MILLIPQYTQEGFAHRYASVWSPMPLVIVRSKNISQSINESAAFNSLTSKLSSGPPAAMVDKKPKPKIYLFNSHTIRYRSCGNHHMCYYRPDQCQP